MARLERVMWDTVKGVLHIQSDDDVKDRIDPGVLADLLEASEGEIDLKMALYNLTGEDMRVVLDMRSKRE